MDDIDIERVRADTPGCTDHIHLNNAGASLPARETVETQIDYLREESIRGGYETAVAHAAEFDDTYAAIGSLIGCGSDEIALTANATEAWQLGFHSIGLERGDRILTGEASYASNFIGFLKLREERGVAIDVVPSDEHGQTSPEALAEMLDERVGLIALTHIPTNSGLINPAAEVGRIARDAGIPFLLDACQSVGQIAIHVEDIGCDMLSATGRKFLRGPRGTGFLYVRREMLRTTRPPFLDLHGAIWSDLDHYEMRSDARRYENWEFNVGAMLGLRTAVRYATRIGMPAIEARVIELAGYLRNRLGSIDGVTVHDIGRRRGAIVTFSVEGTGATEAAAYLAARGVAVSTTTPSSTLVDALRRSLGHMVRASVHYFNTEAELESASEHVADLAKRRPDQPQEA